jgi:hypothetical protein
MTNSKSCRIDGRDEDARVPFAAPRARSPPETACRDTRAWRSPGRCRRPSRRSCRTARLSVQHALLVDEESLHLYATRVGRPSQRDAPLPRRRWSRGLARNSPP